MKFKVLASVLSLIALSYPLGSVRLDALPQNELDTFYYSDATMTDIVGERDILCVGGVYQWGTTTHHMRTQEISCQWGTFGPSVCLEVVVFPDGTRYIPVPCPAL
jgi:hypothetical protein